MKKLRMLSFLVIILLGCSLIFGSVVFAKIRLKDSVTRLDSIVKDQKETEIDSKLIKAIAIIDGMEEGKKWNEVSKLVTMKDFNYSKYYDELLYIYMAHLANEKKLRELESLWRKMSAMQNSIHIFPAMLIRLFAQTNQGSVKFKTELKRILEYIEMIPQNTSIHGPMIEGNALFGYSVREDFSSGSLPKMYTMKEYTESPEPLDGFSNDTQYVGILAASNRAFGIHTSRTVRLAELYEKGKESKKAADIYYSLSKSNWDRKEYIEADKYIKKALNNNPKHTEAKALQKDIELALVLESEGEPIASQDISPASDDSYLTPPGKRLTKRDLRGKSKGMLRLMRNEIFARYGRPFRSNDLHEYFTKKSWYKVNPDYSDELLNAIDRHNILLIKEVEEGK